MKLFSGALKVIVTSNVLPGIIAVAGKSLVTTASCAKAVPLPDNIAIDDGTTKVPISSNRIAIPTIFNRITL